MTLELVLLIFLCNAYVMHATVCSEHNVSECTVPLVVRLIAKKILRKS